MELIAQAEKDLREVYHIPDNYRVLFLQGGARGQICSITNEPKLVRKAKRFT